MNPAMQAHHYTDGDPMMMFLMLMIMCPGMFSGMGQNPMLLIIMMMMMSGGKMF